MVTWTKEQQAAIDRKGSNILVAAAAGSGKTAVLVERIIQKLIDETDPLHIDEILVATFTNAAAEEMRNRIGAALEKTIAEDPTSYHLKKQLSLLQRASISTLHSFCTQIVRQYAYMIDVDPSFRIADEMEMELIKQEVIEEMFEEAYGQNTEEVDAFYRVIDMFSSDRSDMEVEQLILKLYTFAMQHPQPEKWLRAVCATYDVAADIDENSITWLQILKEEVMETAQSFMEEAERALQIARESDGPYTYVDALESDITFFQQVIEKCRSWDEVQSFAQSETFANLSRKKMECNEDKKTLVQAIRKKYREAWNDLKKEWFNRNLAGHMEDMRQLYPAMEELVSLVLQFSERFTAIKKEKAIVDFSDLEHFCLAILTEKMDGTNVVPSDVALQFQKQFKEVLVDEYQDINLVQETILRVVSDEKNGGNMFMVGDVKQSIYRFRHAEPTLFIDKYKKYEEDETAGLRIDLAKNFRSREEVLTSTNFVFKQILDESLGEIEYDDKASLVYGNLSYEEVPLKEAETELLIVDRGTSEERQHEGENVEDLEAWRLEARLYAEKIKTWIGKKDSEPFEVVDKKTNQKRPIQYRDIVILLRSLTNAPIIVDEFKKQGIPVHAELKAGYFEAIEIQIMVNMLKIIDNPYQDIPLVSILRSPIVGLEEDELTTIRLENQKGTYFDSLQTYSKKSDELSKRVRQFLQLLEALRVYAKENGLSDLIWHIFGVTGYYDFVGGIPGGRQRQANLRALYDRAKSYEATSFRGLFRFLRFIERMEEQNKDLGEARALSEQEDVVRIMTIHKSKGLEFPVVIVGGMDTQFNLSDIRYKYILDKDYGFATKFIDPVKRITYPTLYYIALKEASRRKLLAEQMRVLYVAMTRAKEKLVLIGNVASFEKKAQKWSNVVEQPEWILPNQLRKKAMSYLDWVAPAVIRHEHGAALRGEEIAANEDFDMFKDKSKWDVQIIDANELLNMEEAEVVSEETLKEAIQQWKEIPNVASHFAEEVENKLTFIYAHEEAAMHRAKQSVSEIKRRQETADMYSDQRLLQPFRAPLVKRPNFLQKEETLTRAEIGTAMHTVLQHIPFTKQLTRDEIVSCIDDLVHEEKLTEKEANVISIEMIEQFFQTEIAETMIENEATLQREVPFTYALQASEVYPDWKSEQEEQVMLQGVVDCIIRTPEGLIILDYKTDTITDEEVTEQTISMLKNRYKTQVLLYERAISDILQEEIKASYLYFFDRQLLIHVKDDEINRAFN